jgi:hypothetical protein
MLKRHYRQRLKREFPEHQITDFSLIASVLVKAVRHDFDVVTRLLHHRCKIQHEPFRPGVILGVELVNEIKNFHG